VVLNVRENLASLQKAKSVPDPPGAALEAADATELHYLDDIEERRSEGSSFVINRHNSGNVGAAAPARDVQMSDSESSASDSSLERNASQAFDS